MAFLDEAGLSYFYQKLKGIFGTVKTVNSVSPDASGNVALSINPMPVGAIYVQFAGQAAPADIFGGTWSNVSSSYAGRFFRAEGGSAAAFGSTQSGGLPNITGGFSAGFLWDAIAYCSGAFYMNTITGNKKSWLEHQYDPLREYYFNASRSSSLYGAANEVRPINSTIRIWKRTA